MKKISLLLLSLSCGLTHAQTALPDFAPVAEGQHVVINVPQQRLFLYTNGQISKIYPVAVGKAISQTTLGKHTIGNKAFKPTWHIPKSIQKERNDGVKTIKYGEPGHPLGPVFVRLGDPKLGLGIHGTNVPSSVPGVRSHGCVRMKSPDALEFAKRIATGSPAEVIYQLASLNADGNGNLWLAAYRDPYHKKNLDTKALRNSIAQWSQQTGKTIDEKRLNAVLKTKTGALSCLTCGSKKDKVVAPLQSLMWTTGSAELSQAQMPAPSVLEPQPSIDQSPTDTEKHNGEVEVHVNAE